MLFFYALRTHYQRCHPEGPQGSRGIYCTIVRPEDSSTRLRLGRNDKTGGFTNARPDMSLRGSIATVAISSIAITIIAGPFDIEYLGFSMLIYIFKNELHSRRFPRRSVGPPRNDKFDRLAKFGAV